MKSYENYKVTNISWVKQIPSLWELVRLGSLFYERKTKVSDKNYDPLSVTKKGILPQLANAAKSNDGDNRKLVCQNDFVINSRSDRKGSSGVSSLNGSVSLINIILQPRNLLNQNYINYLLRSNGFIEEYYHKGKGIVADLWTTRFEEMKTILLPMSSSEEQDQIVKYLDWQVSKINKLINAKKKQITLLNEQKQAIINNAVTNGLDENTLMKDSGIYWLKQIPYNWRSERLKNICEINASMSLYKNSFCDNDEVVFLPMENIFKNGVIDCSIKRKYKEVKTGYSAFAKGDVVIAKITPCFENGKGACLDKLETDIGFGTTELITIRPYPNSNPKYLYYITMTSYFRKFGADIMTGSAGQKRISSGYVSNFQIGVPDINLQKEIVKYIESQLVKIDNIIEKVSLEVIKFQEYKTSLISSVVTGKSDVRDIVIPEHKIVDEIVEENDDLDLLEEDVAEEE